MKEPTTYELIVYFGNMIGHLKRKVFSFDEKGWEIANDLEMQLYKKANELKEKGEKLDIINKILEKIQENTLGCKAPCAQEIAHWVKQIITKEIEP